MNHLLADSATFGVVISLVCYGLGVYLKSKTGIAIFNPLLISVIAVMVILSVFHIEYDTYNASAHYLSYLLTPATVSLAIPLYLQLDKLKENFTAIICGLGCGTLTSMVCILAMSILFKLPHETYVTLLPKSITTAIGMGVSETLGGSVTITVAVIIITGILGNIFAEGTLRIFRVVDPVAKGLAIGCSTHAVGTARAMEMGEIEGAMSSLAIVVTGLMTVAAASVFSMIY